MRYCDFGSEVSADCRYRCIHCNRLYRIAGCRQQTNRPELIKGILCKNQPSRGLGDTVAKITSAVGIKPCGGCKHRQQILNKILPY